jgi:hypothetical protein
MVFNIDTAIINSTIDVIGFVNITNVTFIYDRLGELLLNPEINLVGAFDL